MILLDAPISNLVEAEDTLQNPKRMLHFCSDPRLGCVLALACFVHMILELCAAAGHILNVRRGLADQISLALIASLANRVRGGVQIALT